MLGWGELGRVGGGGSADVGLLRLLRGEARLDRCWAGGNEDGGGRRGCARARGRVFGIMNKTTKTRNSHKSTRKPS